MFKILYKSCDFDQKVIKNIRKTKIFGFQLSKNEKLEYFQKKLRKKKEKF